MIKANGTPIVTTMAVFRLIRKYIVRKIRMSPKVRLEMMMLKRSSIGSEES